MMKLHYTIDTVEMAIEETRVYGLDPTNLLRHLYAGWLELHAEIERLRDELRDAATLTAGAVRAESENNAATWSTLRNAAAAVLDRFDEHDDMTLELQAMRIVAGIKAPPQDGDAGDRADEAYEKKGDR